MIQRMRSSRGPSGLVVVTVAILIGGIALRGTNRKGSRLPASPLMTGSVLAQSPATSAPAAAKTASSASATPKQTRARTSTEPAPPPVKVVGSKNAPITFEVFSDYQCPSCRNLYEQTLRPMMNDYVAAGKVYIVHRDFPLPIAAHTHAYEAARWANAAARIGKFEEVDATLYDNQSAWSADGNIEKFVAGSMGNADFKRLEKVMAGACMNDPGPVVGPVRFGNQGCALDAYIEQDKNLGRQVPVQATPTFVIYYKGQKYPAASGFITWPVLKQFLDSLLSQ